jgi:selenocysteine-specific elongation factor
MVAGATGIDLFLLAIDAGEGARPQTHEHLAVLRLLGIERGVVAITKADAVDAETVALAAVEARELVPGAPVVPVSAKTGEGLDELRAAIAAVAAEIPDRPEAAATRLFLDRAFTLRGIGTVATGTLWSGSIGPGDVLEALPAGREVRVRSVQVHDRAVERADAGQRVAVALPGVERQELPRGTALVEPGTFPPSYRLDVALEELEPVRSGLHVRVHHGTAEHAGRVVRAGDRFAQLRLATQAVAARGDRVILRTDTTLAGGVVLDPLPPRHASAERFELLELGDPGALVYAPVREDSLAGAPEGLERAGGWVFSPAWLEERRADLHARLAAADPLDPGIPPPSEPWARDLLPLLGVERRGARIYLPGARGELGERTEAAEALERELDAAGYEPVKVADRPLAEFLEREGRLARVGDGLVVGRAAYDEAERLLVEECSAAGQITLARFRDLLGTGRRPAQLLLERFDADGLTRRVGDARVLRRKRAGND